MKALTFLLLYLNCTIQVSTAFCIGKNNINHLPLSLRSRNPYYLHHEHRLGEHCLGKFQLQLSKDDTSRNNDEAHLFKVEEVPVIASAETTITTTTAAAAAATSNKSNKSNDNKNRIHHQQRQIAKIEKFARLPVWPAWNGALLFLLSQILPNSIIAKLEDTFGGRVCPNFFSDNGSTSPFIMLVHHSHSFFKFDPLRAFQKNVILPEGFPSHAHRGFITLTYCLHGGMVHRDSIGCKQSYGNEKKRHGGNVAQWLITGAGMLHEEMWDINHEEDGLCSRQELFQLWVNVPSWNKMTQPSIYLLNENEENNISNDEGGKIGNGSSDIQTNYAHIPTFQTENGNVETKVLVGDYSNGEQHHLTATTSSSVPLASAMSILHVTMKPNTTWSMKDIPASYRTALIYMRQGSVHIAAKGNGGKDNDENYIPTHNTAYLTQYGNEITTFAGKDGGDFLVLIGEPLNEPIQARGSMVMNTFDEIDEAYNDYSKGRMGIPWDHKLSDEEWTKHVDRFPSIYR
jgi:redox-sensitive bicupin YhaK (pirin superfamily)